MTRIRPVVNTERRCVGNKNIQIPAVSQLIVNKPRNQRNQPVPHLPFRVLSGIAIVSDTARYPRKKEISFAAGSKAKVC